MNNNIKNFETINSNDKKKQEDLNTLSFEQENYNVNCEDMAPYRKEIFDSLRRCVKEDINRGVAHFHLTLKTKKNDKITKEEISGIYYCVLTIVMNMSMHIDLIDFIHLVEEKDTNEKNNLEVPRFDIVFGVRTLFGQVDHIHVAIERYLAVENNFGFDRKLTQSKGYDSVLSLYNYIFKENRYNYLNHWIFLIGQKPFEYVDLNEANQDPKKICTVDIGTWWHWVDYGGYSYITQAFYNVPKHITSNKKLVDRAMIIPDKKAWIKSFVVSREKVIKYNFFYFINIFCKLTKIIYTSNGFYQKDEKGQLTYRFLGNYKYFKYNIEKITKVMSTYLRFQMLNVEKTSWWYEMVTEGLKELKYYIHFFNLKDVRLDLIEFRNGIYSIRENVFFNFETEEGKKIKDEKIYCFRYFDFNWEYVTKKSPIIWLNEIKKKLDDNKINKKQSNKELAEFCTVLGGLFFLKNKITGFKNNGSFINEGIPMKKIFLIVKLLENLLEGDLTTLKNSIIEFKLNNTKKTNIVIPDKFKWREELKLTLLKLLTGGSVLIDKKSNDTFPGKGQKELIFLLSEKNPNDEVFLKRVNKCLFSNPTDILKFNDLQGRRKELELARVLLYCCRLYWKSIEKKTSVRGKQKNQSLLRIVKKKEIYTSILEEPVEFLPWE